MTGGLLLALLLAPLWDKPFALPRAGEATARVTARCAGCSWADAEATGAFLILEIDGRYARHVVLTRGDERPAPEYAVALGALAAGRHRLVIRADHAPEPAERHPVTIEGVSVTATVAGDSGYRAQALAPILHPRANALGLFTDVPLVMWYETEPTARGVRIRYSVIFSNEDGGTPSDRLMATWGRLTDIEYVLGIETTADGRVLEAEYQGADHRIRSLPLPLRGHPELWVVTDNNMVADQGTTTPVYAPVAVPFDLAFRSREAVMDANPWTWTVSSQEALREGHVDAGARPGSGRVLDPRRFVYVEACAETRDAALTFGIATGAEGARVWSDSDGGLPAFRIRRRPDQFPNGCFRGAVGLPAGVEPDDVSAVRFRAFTRAPDAGEAPLPPGAGRARLRRLSRVFVLDTAFQPRLLPIAWTGDLELPADGPPVEVPFSGPRPRP